jgi:hypothetical protein
MTQLPLPTMCPSENEGHAQNRLLDKKFYRYLDYGNVHNGFARVKCRDFCREYLLAFSCKRRHFFPSCHQKRVVEFGEWLCQEAIKAVPH